MDIVDRLNDPDLYVDAVDDAVAIIQDLRGVCQTAIHALRSYQYGNASPDLAEEVANQVEKVLRIYHD